MIASSDTPRFQRFAGMAGIGQEIGQELAQTIAAFRGAAKRQSKRGDHPHFTLPDFGEGQGGVSADS
jgi:hypothetical protein